MAATASQLTKYESLSQMFNARSTYLPHACFSLRVEKQASYAFHAPYFAISNFDVVNVFRIMIYDVVRGELYQVIHLNPISSPLASPTSILLNLELSDKYLCVCLNNAVIIVKLRCRGKPTEVDGTHILQRDSVCFIDERHPFENKHRKPQAERVLRHASTVAWTDGVQVPGTDNVALKVLPGVDELEDYAVVAPPGELPYALPGSSQRGAPCFISGVHIIFIIPYYPKSKRTHFAVKFSPNGRHVVVGSMSSYLYFFPDIDRMFNDSLAPREIVQKVACGAPVKRIEWEKHGRVFAFRDVRHSSLLYLLNGTERYYSGISIHGLWTCVRHITHIEESPSLRRRCLWSGHGLFWCTLWKMRMWAHRGRYRCERRGYGRLRVQGICVQMKRRRRKKLRRLRLVSYLLIPSP
jgi:hypothetical protein